jgi:TonB family protein
MSSEIAYFLKVNIALALFYVCYRLFFRKDTFFGLRRALLLLCFGLALAYPWIDIREWIREQKPMAELAMIYSAILAEVQVKATPTAGSEPNTFLRILPAAYWLGVASLLLHYLIQAGRIIRLSLQCRTTVIRNTKIYALSKPSGPFSFFRLIFLHPGSHTPKETDEILAHERIHAFQWHSLDLLAGKCICIACWMNPFAWLLTREVRHNLEYLADKGVLASGFDSRSYQYHLLSLTCPQAAANLYNNFNVSHLKNRIRMMNKKRSRAIERTKYVIFLPAVALLMLLANIEPVAHATHAPQVAPVPQAALQPEAPVAPQAPQDKKKVYTVVEEMPQFPGGDSELLKFINTSIKYPLEAQTKKIEGRVIVQFVVNEDGRISDEQVTKTVAPSLDAEALRVLRQMPRWTPGKQGGKAVAVAYTVPITFRLK